MSREILFKAKRKDNGEWVQGYYYQIWGKGYILWGMTNNMPDMVEVNPDTLCQYTGLTDKYGKKIWENDIAVDKDNDYYKVFWNKDLFNYSLECIKTEHLFLRGKRWDLYLFAKNDTLKVVGNIFDNPELLEE